MESYIAPKYNTLEQGFKKRFYSLTFPNFQNYFSDLLENIFNVTIL